LRNEVISNAFDQGMPAILLQNMRVVEGDDDLVLWACCKEFEQLACKSRWFSSCLEIAASIGSANPLSRAKQKGAEHHALRL